MAKDPRFNFYPDNWEGGTDGFTLEQEGAYLSLIIMQSRVGRFTAEQAIDKLLRKTRGNTAVCTGLWSFLIPKFETDGKLFWSARLEKEITKSKIHSEKQKERVLKRWNKKEDESGITAVIPVIEVEMELEIEENKIGVPENQIPRLTEIEKNLETMNPAASALAKTYIAANKDPDWLWAQCKAAWATKKIHVNELTERPLFDNLRDFRPLAAAWLVEASKTGQHLQNPKNYLKPQDGVYGFQNTIRPMTGKDEETTAPPRPKDQTYNR